MNREDRRAILKVLRATRLLDDIDAFLNGSPGPNSSIRTETVLFAFIATAAEGGGAAARLDRATTVLRQLEPAQWRNMGLPDDQPFHPAANLTAVQRRNVNRRFYQRFVDKIDRINQWAALTDGTLTNGQRLTDALITASLPEHARTYNSLVFDSAPVRAAEHQHHKQPEGHDGDGPSWRITSYTHERDGKTITEQKSIYGYQLTTMLRVDPTNTDPVPWIGAVELSSGSAHEPTVARRLIDIATRTTPVLDLVIADRGYTMNPAFRQHVNRYHGDLVMDYTQHQYRPQRMPCGAINIAGAAYDPATPTSLWDLPRRTTRDAINRYLTDRADKLDRWRLPEHTPPDVHGHHRLQGACRRGTLACTHQPALAHTHIERALPVVAPDRAPNLPVCNQTTVTLTPADYRLTNHNGEHVIDTWQPLPYGTWEWAQVYTPWRSRIEGTLGTLTEHHGMWGGRHGFKVRKHPTLNLFAVAAAVAYNLTRQGHFSPAHGTENRRDDRQLNPPQDARDRLARLLTRRHKQRQAINPATCSPDCAPATPNGGGADPPAN